MADNDLNPAYVQGLAASNRLTDARGEVYRLAELVSPAQGATVIRLYNQLCSVQGSLEALLNAVPTHKGEPTRG